MKQHNYSRFYDWRYFSENELLEMVRFYTLEPKNEQARMFAESAQQELDKRRQLNERVAE